MKFFSWVQNKINGNQGNGQPTISPKTSKYHHAKQHSQEEFNDWPHRLLSTGTFGNSNLKENRIQESRDAEEDPSSPPPVDHQISSSACSFKFDERDEEIERTISIIIRKFKEMYAHNGKNRIGKKSKFFLLKKIFVCSNGFLTDTPESRMERLMRTMLQHKTQNGSSSRTDQEYEQCSYGSKWVKTDSEYIVLEI